MNTINRRATRLPLATLVLTFLALAPAAAAPGDLDRSFGRNGKVTVDVFSWEDVADVAPVKKSKLVLAGTARTGEQVRPALTRLHRDGSLDREFGDDGRVILDGLPGGDVEVVAIDPKWHGPILVLLNVDHEAPQPDEFAVVRLLRDGAIDTTFGSGGYALATFAGQSSKASGLARTEGGSITVGGSGGGGFTTARLTAGGQVDPDWSADVATFPGTLAVATSFATGAGKLVVTGWNGEDIAPYERDGWNEDVAVARFRADGTLDPEFAGDGTQTIGLSGPDERAEAVLVRPNGAVITGGRTADSGRTGLLTMLRRDGEPRKKFGRNGMRLLNMARPNGINGPNNRIVDLTVSGGRILAGGDFFWENQRGSHSRFALAKLRGNGKIARRFGDRGRVHTKIRRFALANALTRSGPGARAVLAGKIGGAEAGLARYRVDR